jgi:hypothetical protein
MLVEHVIATVVAFAAAIVVVRRVVGAAAESPESPGCDHCATGPDKGRTAP